MRKMLCFLLSAFGFATAATAQIPIIDADELMRAFHEEAAHRIEDELNAYEEENLDTTDWIPEADEWDQVFRTSDWEATVTDRPEGPRIGCICMDGTPQDDRGRGACGGRGGVRFWLHQQGDSIFMDPTIRHKAHPDPYTDEDKERLAAYNESKGTAFGSSNKSGISGDFKEIVLVMMVCLTIAYVARLYFTHQPEEI